MATKQQAPWATGKHKPTSGRKRPVSSASKGMLGRIGGNAKRGWKKTLRKHPSVGIVASIVLAVVAVVSLILGLVLESALYYLVMALSGLGTLAIQRARRMERDRQAAQPRARPTTGGPKTPPSAGAGPKPPAGGVIRCTETGQPIEGDGKCTCASRHIATEKGRSRYGGSLGDPIGKRSKPSATTRSST